MSSVGNRIFTKIDRPERALIEKFAGMPSSNISDGMNSMYCMHGYIKLLNPERARPLLGPALTVKVPCHDNLFLHRAIDIAEPGDVIVVDAATGRRNAMAGEIMLRLASARGIAGVVVDGYLRDLDALKTLEMPIYAAGITPQAPTKAGPGEINVPVSCGGQVVLPGDIIVGDLDGIVVVRGTDAEELAALAERKGLAEQGIFAQMRSEPEAFARAHAESSVKLLESRGAEVMETSYSEHFGL